MPQCTKVEPLTSNVRLLFDRNASLKNDKSSKTNYQLKTPIQFSQDLISPWNNCPESRRNPHHRLPPKKLSKVHKHQSLQKNGKPNRLHRHQKRPRPLLLRPRHQKPHPPLRSPNARHRRPLSLPRRRHARPRSRRLSHLETVRQTSIQTHRL